MAWDKNHGLLWQVNVDGDNGIYGLDPADGSVKNVITGLALDEHEPARPGLRPGDRHVLHRRLERGHRLPRGRARQPDPGDHPRPVRHRRSEHLRARLEPVVRQAVGRHELRHRHDLPGRSRTPARRPMRSPIPDGGGFGGAGLEMDAAGNLWTVGQNSGNAYLIDSGLPNFSDAAWLTVSPTDGTLAPDASTALDVAVDPTGLDPRRLPGDRRRPDERPRQQGRPGPGHARRARLPAGHQRRRQGLHEHRTATSTPPTARTAAGRSAMPGPARSGRPRTRSPGRSTTSSTRASGSG